MKACFQQLQRELLYLKTADHPNVIRLCEVFEDKRNVNIVMDYLSGGELYDRLEQKQRFPEREAATVMYKLFHAVSHLHYRGICHRDLKPENFLYDCKRENAEIKIIDFGLGNKFDSVNNEMHTVVGTPYYVAPEVLRRHYGKECDVWSLGVIMYAVLVGFPPFNGASDQEIQRKILKGDFHFRYTEWETISKEAKDLIKNLLNQDPAKRLPANEVLNHAWFHIIDDVIHQPVSPAIISHLREFRSGGALRCEALRIITQFIPNDAIRNLTVAFRTLDEDHIGYLSQEGVIRITQKGENAVGISAEEAQILFGELDLYQGRMPFTEYIVAAMDREVYAQVEPITASFKFFDSTDKGDVTVDDVRKAFTKSGKVVMDDEIQRLIREYDGNQDGKLSFEEFKSMIELQPVTVSAKLRQGFAK